MKGVVYIPFGYSGRWYFWVLLLRFFSLRTITRMFYVHVILKCLLCEIFHYSHVCESYVPVFSSWKSERKVAKIRALKEYIGRFVRNENRKSAFEDDTWWGVFYFDFTRIKFSWPIWRDIRRSRVYGTKVISKREERIVYFQFIISLPSRLLHLVRDEIFL